MSKKVTEIPRLICEAVLCWGFLPANPANPVNGANEANGAGPPVEMTVKLGRISFVFGGIYGESMADWLT